LLALIAFDLNRQSGRYGTLPFPRLITGQIAIAADLDSSDRDTARDQIRQVLEQHQKTGRVLKNAISTMLQCAFDAMGRSHGVQGVGAAVEDVAEAYGAEVVLGGLLASRRGRRWVLGTGQDWYGHQDRNDRRRSSLDVLVELNRMAAASDAESRREVAELLWRAFLADLRDSFEHSRRARSWTLNCVVLLDNTDTAIGHYFLDELVMARRQRAAYAPDEHDPLTVVATSRGELAEWIRLRGESVVMLADACYDGYLERSRTEVGRWWYPVLLPDLTVDEVGSMVSALALPGGTQQKVTLAVHGFTHGHPGATRMMLDAIAENPGALHLPGEPSTIQVPDRSVDLVAILAAPEPGGPATGGRTVEEGLLSRLIEGVPPETAEDLATCAAARHEEAALQLAAESGLLRGMRGESSLIFAASLWRTGAPGRAGELHPVLRRLLLRRLAARDQGSAADWTHVFGWLRASCEKVDDEVGELYNALALGDVEHVARWFARSLEHGDPVGWVRFRGCVTSAPNRLDHRQPYPSQIDDLTGWADGRELRLLLVGRLIAAQWICADPLSASGRASLLREMAQDLDDIAPYFKGGITVLRDEADRYGPAAAGYG
jgi:hypothetical protein